MQGNRSSGTSPEVRLARAMRALGMRPRRQVRLPIDGRRRTADFAWPGRRVAVFVDGCYWHCCPDHALWPAKTNASYWSAKLSRNVERDRDTDASLAELGWTVVRMWEHVDAGEAARQVAEALRTVRRAA